LKVALTGGAGFIGSCLIHRLLDDGHTVQALTRNPDKLEAVFPQVVPFAADLASPTSALSGFAEDCDVFFHCAGELSNQTAMTALHVEGTQRLIEHLSGRVPRWVQLSSVGAYGARHSGHVDEDTVENPVGEYEITKAKSDQSVFLCGRKGSDDKLHRCRRCC